jgi:branched-chain amino acid transport system permease protein
MQDLLQQLLNGLLAGGVYALFALGLTLSLGVLRVMNLAHGVTFALAAIAAVKLEASVSLSFPLLIVFGGLVGAAIGALLEVIAFRPLRSGRSERNVEMASLVASMAALYILLTLAERWTDGEILTVPSHVYQSSIVHILGLSTRSILLISFLIALVLVSACWWVVNRTQLGRAMRAVAVDDEAAAMIGVNATRVKFGTMIASGALAGIAGVLIGVSLGAVSYEMGQDELLRGFSVVILGGIGSVPGVIVGGLLLGLGEGTAAHFFGGEWQPAAPFVLLFFFLVVRPRGFFGRAEVDRA